MLHSYRSVRATSWRPDLQVYARQWSQKPVLRAPLPPSPNKHGKLTGSLWCINYLCFFNHNPQPVILCMIWFWDKLLWPPSRLPQFIFILFDIFVTNDLRKGVGFQRKMLFKMGMMKGCHPYHLLSRDDQGLPGLWEGLRWWLSWFRCEQKDCPLI
jgi:hypothetical protein